MSTIKITFSILVTVVMLNLSSRPATSQLRSGAVTEVKAAINALITENHAIMMYNPLLTA